MEDNKYSSLGKYFYVHDHSHNYMLKERERDNEIEPGYDYFGARYYNSKLGIWLQADPKGGKYPGWSPYNYTASNSLKFVDPNGREIELHKNTTDPRFQAAWNLLLRTEMGLKLAKEINDSHEVLAVFLLVNYHHTKVGHADRMEEIYRENKPIWLVGGKNYERFGNIAEDFFLRNDKYPYLITIDPSVVGTIEFAEVIYHELYSHIVLQLRLGINKVGLSSEGEENSTGYRTEGQIPAPGTIMDKLRKQLLEKYNKKGLDYSKHKELQQTYDASNGTYDR